MGSGFQADAFQADAFQTGGAAPVVVAPTLPPVTARALRGAALDQYLDPITLDYVDTPNGEWLETADSRTIVLIMLETELEKSFSAPGDGTRIKEFFANGDPVTVGFVESEYRRAMGILEAAGVISDFSITSTDSDGKLLVDAKRGRYCPLLRWIDLATGSPVDLAYAPL